MQTDFWLPKDKQTLDVQVPNSKPNLSTQQRGQWQAPKDQKTEPAAKQVIELKGELLGEAIETPNLDLPPSILDLDKEDLENIAAIKVGANAFSAIQLIKQKVNIRRKIDVAKRENNPQKVAMLRGELELTSVKLREIELDKTRYPNGLPTEKEALDFYNQNMPMRRNKKGGEQ